MNAVVGVGTLETQIPFGNDKRELWSFLSSEKRPSRHLRAAVSVSPSTGYEPLPISRLPGTNPVSMSAVVNNALNDGV
jgi:hypothetical protein